MALKISRVWKSLLMDNEREQDTLDKLILSGALSISGVDPDTGEFLYQFTDKLKEVSPILYNEHISYINFQIMKFWKDGFLEINFTEDSPIIFLSEKCFDEQAVSSLSKEDKWNIEEIKRIFKDKNSDIIDMI